MFFRTLYLVAFSFFFVAVAWSGEVMLTGYTAPLHLLVFGVGILSAFACAFTLIRD